MIKDIEQIQRSLENIQKTNDETLQNALKELTKLDPEKSKEFSNLANKVKGAENQEEAQHNLNELLKRCQLK